MLDAIATANKGGTTKGAAGCSVAGMTGNDIDGAVAVAAKAEAVVLAVGIDQSQER